MTPGEKASATYSPQLKNDVSIIDNVKQIITSHSPCLALGYNVY